MKIPRIISVHFLFVLLILSGSCKNSAPASSSLPRSTPEAEGVSSAGQAGLFYIALQQLISGVTTTPLR